MLVFCWGKKTKKQVKGLHKKSKIYTIFATPNTANNDGQNRRRRRGGRCRRRREGMELWWWQHFGEKGDASHHVLRCFWSVVDVFLFLCFSLWIPHLLTLLHSWIITGKNLFLSMFESTSVCKWNYWWCK